ncbi:hypothetical protein CIB95_01310 [Lottiidibacillus patelloidae]|uniref:Peptidase S9 prolyl oligopeptidase catalytic domain-containing protein n=1 Tax=Lottiidibacillus patelloidae TaxID=2670334 RepID=A0A263BWX9_9BACI|nr:esterase [Lottiidibacillus patelloidae]OZM58239.1 hypothetical protein CIB95_01310 [Lottiidibacillus patelloidae]
MITIVHEHINGNPILHVCKEELRNEKLPLVIFSHGFTSAKEHNLHFAYLLAEENMRVILPDAIHHGERENNISEKKRALSFWDIVINQISELYNIKEAYQMKNLILEDKIAIGGTSMGAIISLGALSQYKWIKAAISYMGTPYYQHFATAQLEQLQSDKQLSSEVNMNELALKVEQLAIFELTNKLDHVKPTPLFLWHGKKDNVVPFQYSEKLYETLQQKVDWKDNVTFVADEHSDHKVSRSALIQSINWLVNTLN